MKIKFNGNDVNITTSDDLMAVLYKKHLEETAKAFLNAAKSNQQIKKALIDKALLEQLADILDEYVAIGVSADLQSAPLRKVARNSMDFTERDHSHPDMSKCQAFLYYASDPGPSANLDLIFGGAFPQGNNKRSDADAYQKYFEWFVNRDVKQGGKQQSGIDAFYERYPIIKHAVDISTLNFKNNIISACENICKDWNLIFKIFMNKSENNEKDPDFTSEDAMKLMKISSTGNDFHKGGKQVLILTFSNGKNKTKKLVYKPADIEMDYRLVGNTAIQANNSTDLGYLGTSQSLMELINGFFPFEDRYRLPTYRILPRNPGSGLKADDDGTIPIQDSYGYIEFLTHEPANKDTFGRAILPSSNKKASSKVAYDWVIDDQTADENTIKQFYRQWGRLLTIASLFSLSDLHQGNIIIHNYRPYLIDLEISFTGPLTGLNGTFAQGGMTQFEEPSNDRWRCDVATPKFFMDTEKARETSPAKNRLYSVKGDKLINPNDYVPSIFNGLIETIDIIQSHKNDVQNWLNNSQLPKAIARFTPYATPYFYTELRTFYSNKTSIESADVPDLSTLNVSEISNPWKSSITKALDAWKSPTTADQKKWPAPRPNYAIQDSQHNFKDYLNCDIPAYYHRLVEYDLLNARGEKVIIKPSKLNPNPVPDRDTYFPNSTWDEIVHIQLASFFTQPTDHLDACRQDLMQWFRGSAGLIKARALIYKKST